MIKKSIIFFLILLFAPFCNLAAKSKTDARQNLDYRPFPNPDSGYVTDLANLLTTQEEERIEQWLWQVEKKKLVEIIVMTIDSIKDYPETDNRSIKTFAKSLFDTYGIGNMPANNGILFLIAKKDRKARIELGAGYGKRMDAAAKRIMKNVIIPHFKNNQYSKGITEGVRAIIKDSAALKIGFNWKLIGLIALFIIGIFVAISLFRSGKKGWGWAVVAILFFILFGIIKIINALPGRSSSWSSGGSGGFGGGFSGGGGSTGSW